MIICSGCSFTIGSHQDKDGNTVDYKHWPEFLPYSKNVAKGGAGNRVIARQVLNELATVDSTQTTVVVMWSTVERYDYYDPVYNAYTFEGASFTGNKEQYLKYFYSNFNQFAKTLEYILLVQQTCKVRHIPYVFSHMGDIRYKDWDMDAAYGIKHTESGAQRTISSVIDNSVPTFFDMLETESERDYIKSLWEQIDWSHWAFWKDNGGLWQLTNDKGYEWIAYHPPEEAHKDWAENIIIPKLQELNAWHR